MSFVTAAPGLNPGWSLDGEEVLDRLTRLRWLQRADLCDGLASWAEALLAVRELNLRRSDATPWRLPNVNELESLVDCSQHSPALPQGHPFLDVATEYWTSTPSAYEPDWAWALYLTKGAVGVGQERGRYSRAWAVRDA